MRCWWNKTDPGGVSEAEIKLDIGSLYKTSRPRPCQWPDAPHVADQSHQHDAFFYSRIKAAFKTLSGKWGVNQWSETSWMDTVASSWRVNYIAGFRCLSRIRLPSRQLQNARFFPRLLDLHDDLRRGGRGEGGRAETWMRGGCWRRWVLWSVL